MFLRVLITKKRVPLPFCCFFELYLQETVDVNQMSCSVMQVGCISIKLVGGWGDNKSSHYFSRGLPEKVLLLAAYRSHQTVMEHFHADRKEQVFSGVEGVRRQVPGS